MCLAGPIQQISSLAADTGINYSVIGPFSIWSFKLRFLCCLTQGEGGGFQANAAKLLYYY